MEKATGRPWQVIQGESNSNQTEAWGCIEQAPDGYTVADFWLDIGSDPFANPVEAEANAI